MNWTIKGVEALNEMADFTQEQVDHIVHHAAIAALDKHMYLAKLAVDETGRGIYEDKAIKNMYASEYIWNSIKNDKTVGVIAEDKEQGLVSIAEPVGDYLWGNSNNKSNIYYYFQSFDCV